MDIWIALGALLFIYFVVQIKRNRSAFDIALLIWGLGVPLLALANRLALQQGLATNFPWDTARDIYFVFGAAIGLYYAIGIVWPYPQLRTPHLFPRALEFYEQGDLHNATRIIQRLVAIQPRDPGARYWLGRLLNQEGKYRRAIWHLKFARELAPDSIDILNELGFAYKMRKQYAKAVSLFEQVLTLDPKNTYALEQLDICRQIPQTDQ